jgi:hypothetical protein
LTAISGGVMRQSHFESIIEVQNRHIERLERMVEQLFNTLSVPKISLAKSDEPEADYDYHRIDEELSEKHLVGSVTNRPLG